MELRKVTGATAPRRGRGNFQQEIIRDRNVRSSGSVLELGKYCRWPAIAANSVFSKEKPA